MTYCNLLCKEVSHFAKPREAKFFYLYRKEFSMPSFSKIKRFLEYTLFYFADPCFKMPKSRSLFLHFD